MATDTPPIEQPEVAAQPDPQPAAAVPPVAPTPEPEVEEVEFDEAKVEEAPKAAAAEAEQAEDVLDIIVPKNEPRLWVLGPESMRREYIQKELSFIGKMQWFSLVGDVLDKALSGPQGMSLNSLFSAPGRPGQLSAADFRDADTFVQAVGKLLAVAPDFLVKSYCIWLNVPDYERDIVASIMALPADEGGLSDDDGLAIIETFLVQNYDSLADFFGDKLTRIGQLVQKKNQLRSERAESPRSKH